MAVSLKISTVSEPVRVTFKLRQDVKDMFDLYVKAVQEATPNCDESVVMEAILENHFKRDKEFKKWLKNYSPDESKIKEDDTMVAAQSHRVKTGESSSTNVSALKS